MKQVPWHLVCRSCRFYPMYTQHSPLFSGVEMMMLNSWISSWISIWLIPFFFTFNTASADWCLFLKPWKKLKSNWNKRSHLLNSLPVGFIEIIIHFKVIFSVRMVRSHASKYFQRNSTVRTVFLLNSLSVFIVSSSLLLFNRNQYQLSLPAMSCWIHKTILPIRFSHSSESAI